MTDGEEAASPPSDASALVRPPLRFSGIIASSGRLYAACLRPLILLFASIGAVIFLFPALIFFDVGDNLAISLYLLAGVVLPSTLLSLGFAVASVVLARYLRGEDHRVRPSLLALRARRRDLLVAGLMSGMLALALVVFFGPLGSLLIALFYGPPILVQAIALEDRPIQDAWARTRAMMQGHWARILMALLTVALGLGILATTMLGVGGELAADLGRPARVAIFIVLELVIFGFGYSFLAAANLVCYLDVNARAGDDSAAVE